MLQNQTLNVGKHRGMQAGHHMQPVIQWNQLESDALDCSGKVGESEGVAVILTWTFLGCQPSGILGGQTL